MVRENATTENKRKRENAYDYSLLFLTVLFVVLGLVFIYSSSSYSATLKMSDGLYYLKRQAAFGAFGIVVMLIISRIPYPLYIMPVSGQADTKSRPYTADSEQSTNRRKSGRKFRAVYLLYFLCLCLQIITLIPGIGVVRNGARRWIEIPKIGQFQPSELTKIGMIVFMAFLASIAPKALNYVGGFIRATIYAIPLILLVAAEDFSTALVIAGIFFIICFVASKKYWFFIAFCVIGAAAGALYIYFGEGFREARIEAWLNVDTSEKAYQIRRGLYAISSGGFMGKGLGQSSMKLGFVPESHNDMIFSIICEELGLVGAILIILLYILLLWRIFVVAVNAPDLFGSLLCVGVFAHISLQLILNIAVVTNTVPATGIALPFISYGGTSLVLLLCEIGMVLSVSYNIGNPDFARFLKSPERESRVQS